MESSPWFRRESLRLLVLLLALLAAVSALAADATFTPQLRLGFAQGDQWEPAIAADGFGHVYVLYPQYGRLPGCASCVLPSMTLVMSDDNGVTWQPPRGISPHTSGQFDAQVVVDPIDRRTVYASWLQNRNTDAIVAKSVDFGQSWSIVIADRGDEDADKPILAVRGLDVYVAFNRRHRMRVASSHDGGFTFTSSEVYPALIFMRSLAGGAVIDPDGIVHLAWAGYRQRASARGGVILFTSKSSDGGRTWATRLMDVSSAPPDCSAFHCEWGYLGAQITLAADAAGTLYALWNSGNGDGSPERIYFASSTTAGDIWSPKTDVSLAPSGVEHAFPTAVAGSAGDVRIAWMDTRNRPLWNTFYRSSTNGGATWSTESRISSYVPGYRYVHSRGFSFPFGDYFEMGIDNRGGTQAVWGEGLNYRSPGSIWYSRGR